MTFRADECQRIVPLGKKNMRCEHCDKVLKVLGERVLFSQKTEGSYWIPNKCLTLPQAQAKLTKQLNELRRQKK